MYHTMCQQASCLGVSWHQPFVALPKLGVANINTVTAQEPVVVKVLPSMPLLKVKAADNMQHML